MPLLSQTPLADTLKTLSNNWVKVDQVQQTVTLNKGGVIAVGNKLNERDSLSVQIGDAVRLIDSINKEVVYHKKENERLREVVIPSLENKIVEKETQGVLNMQSKVLEIDSLQVDLKSAKKSKWKFGIYGTLLGGLLMLVFGG